MFSHKKLPDVLESRRGGLQICTGWKKRLRLRGQSCVGRELAFQLRCVYILLGLTPRLADRAPDRVPAEVRPELVNRLPERVGMVLRQLRFQLVKRDAQVPGHVQSGDELSLIPKTRGRGGNSCARRQQRLDD